LCVAADPLSESAQRALMRLLAEEGNQAAALSAYRDLRLLLHHELCAAPDPETVALYEQIRAAARERAGGCVRAVGQSAKGKERGAPHAALTALCPQVSSPAQLPGAPRRRWRTTCRTRSIASSVASERWWRSVTC
jgi:hypothetical protein